MKKYFFGWTNIKTLIREFLKIYSHEKSYFSKKRIESGIAFLVAQWGLIHWLVLNVHKLSVSEITWWAAVDLAVSGYMVKQIQSEKSEVRNDNGDQV